MKKNRNKGYIATELLCLLFVPGAIPVFIGTLLYKLTKRNKKIMESA